MDAEVTPGAGGIDRYGTAIGPAERRVDFVLVPTFGMLGYVAALEPLRAANRMSGRALYAWRTWSLDGEPVRAANGMVQSVDGAISEAEDARLVVVCGAFDPERFADRRLERWLRRVAARGARVGALDTAAYVLARAGLLDGRRCTVHWENLEGFTEAFPHLRVTSELYEIDGGGFTCAGGVAALDLVLSLIRTHHGPRLAAAVSEAFVHDVIRHPDAPQRMTLESRVGVSHPRLVHAVEIMERNLEAPLLPGELAARVGVSKRQLERLFKRYLGTSPSRYYMGLRLRRGRSLVEQTSLPVIQVALACGFSSPAHFSHRYRAYYGRSPRAHRLAAAEPGSAGS